MPRRRSFRRLPSKSLSRLWSGCTGIIPQLLGAKSHLNESDGQTGSGARRSRFVTEPLEQRVLMTVVGPADGQVEYYATNGGAIRIAWHDMTAELVGVAVGTTGNTEGFPVDQGTEAEFTPDTVTPKPDVVADLYTIYILQSTFDSWMSIASVAPPTTTPVERPMLPFGGTPIEVVDDGTPTSITLIGAPVGTNVGVAVLGALHNGTGDTGLPILNSVVNNGASIGPPLPSQLSPLLEPGVYMSPIALQENPSDNPLNPSDFVPILSADGRDTPNDIGRFMFGGAVTGGVDIPAPTPGTVDPAPASQGGNVGLFYAGSILTGDATGESGYPAEGKAASSVATNFFVGGDIRDLVTAAGIGGGRGAAVRVDASQYVTDFRGVVAGTVGEIHMYSGGFFGSFDVEHLPSVYGLPNTLFPEHELEAIVETGALIPEGDYFGPNQNGGIATTTGYPLLPSNEFSNNHAADATTAATGTGATPNAANLGDPQYLGAIKETDPKTGLPVVNADGQYSYMSEVSGVLEGDAPNTEFADNYAIPLLAGQTITPSLTIFNSDGTVATSQLVTLSVIDPDGRIISTTNYILGSRFNNPFQVTTDRPGIYDFQITFGPGSTLLGDIPYTLTVLNVGDMGLGTIAADNATADTGATTALAGDMYDIGYNSAFEVDNGDLGAMLAGANIASSTGPNVAVNAPVAVTPNTIVVSNGNLREVKAGSISSSAYTLGIPATPVASGGQFLLIPYLNVPNGAVGLLEATDSSTGGVLAVITRFDEQNAANVLGQSFTVPLTPVAGDFQVIDGASLVFLDIATNQGVGVIMAGNMATGVASFIDVNADNNGNDGVIDLINTVGNLGTVGSGGPEIETHGGYVRYMRVSGTVYEDSYFGGGFPVSTVYEAGQVATITEDTGAIVSFTPIGPVTTTTSIIGGTTTTTSTGPQISLETYGIRDGGGSVVLNATCLNGAMTINARGGSEADISQIQFTGDATTTVVPGTTLDSNGEPVLTTIATTSTDTFPSSLIINGKTAVNVLDIVVTGNVDSIQNNTPGEIASLSLAGSAGSISSSGSLGLIAHTTLAAVVLSDNAGGSTAFAPGGTFPWSLQTTGVSIAGNVISISANQGIGNIDVIGDVELIAAGNDGNATTFNGIAGPVLANGSLLNVNIGHGILPSGTGNFSFSGLYATGDIGNVTNGGASGTDIRGNIVAQGKIDNITIGNSSIIGAVIESITSIAASVNGSGERLATQQGPITTTNPIFELGKISIQGDGGIIGSVFFAADVGPITVASKGYGIFSSNIGTIGEGVIGQLTVGGYGIRDSTIGNGAIIQGISLTGNGSQLPVNVFGQDVRESESETFDPYSGFEIGPYEDLDANLGTSLTNPNINNVTDTGVLQDDFIRSTTTLGNVIAAKIRTNETLLTTGEAEPEPNIPVIGQSFPMQINIAGNIQSITVRRLIDGLQITTGNLGKFSQSGSVSRLGISVAGAISKLTINGNFGQSITSPGTGAIVPDSYIDASGAAGTIQTLNITGSLYGTVTASAAIDHMTVGGSVIGDIIAEGNSTRLTLGYLHVGGSIKDGSLSVNGSAGTIITNGGLGDSTGSLTINGNLESLTVGASHAPGHNLALALHVNATLGKLIVFGQITGAVTVGGNLKMMRVADTGNAGSLVSAPITVHGGIGSAILSDGNISANIIADGSIASFNLARGSVEPSATIQSNLETINSFRITGGGQYGMLGSLLAANSVNESIDISGNLGDGTDPASITADSGKLFRIRGSMLANASIFVNGDLGLLEVDGNIAAGATVTAHPLTKLKVIGTNAGIINGT